MKGRWLIVTALVALVAACDVYDPNKYIVSPSSLDAILSFSASRTSVPADGISTTLLTVQIDSRSSKRDVQFTASDGSFTVGAQTDVKKALVTADLTGKAVTELRSTTTVGTVKVDAAIQIDANQTIRRTLDLSFTLSSADDVLTLTSAASTLPADGFSRVAVTGTLKLTGGNTTQRQITFKSSEGLLYAAGKAADVSQVLPVSADGIAIVDLESTKNLRDAHVTATVAGVTREIVIGHAPINPATIISVAPSSSTAPADGASTTLITAQVAAGLPTGRREVTFVTTPPATLSRPTVTADASNRASVVLQSLRTTGPIRISATVDGTSADATVQLVPALPDRIIMSVNKPTVKANATDAVTITAVLQRDIGLVSTGTNVTFTAADLDGTPVGTFAQNSVSDANGTATATFFPGVETAPGPITITAKVAGSAAVGTIRILVVAP